jgi:hypothetical protein
MTPHGRTKPNPEVLINDYEETLGSMVGCLSRFIVRKQFGRLVERNQALDRDGLRTLTDLIVDEAALLVGPVKADELKNKLAKVNDSHFGKEA